MGTAMISGGDAGGQYTTAVGEAGWLELRAPGGQERLAVGVGDGRAQGHGGIRVGGERSPTVVRTARGVLK